MLRFSALLLTVLEWFKATTVIPVHTVMVTVVMVLAMVLAIQARTTVMDTTMASRLTTTTKTTNQWPKAKSSPSASHKRLRSFEISWHKLNPQHIV